MKKKEKKEVANGVTYSLIPISQLFMRETERFINARHSPLQYERGCVQGLLKHLNNAIDSENYVRDEDVRIRKIKELPLISIAMLISARPDMALIAPGDKSGQNQKLILNEDKKMKLPIAKYQSSGDNKGIWEITNSPKESFGALVEKYKPGATEKEKKEVYMMVKARLKVIRKCVIPYYAIMNNCIIDVLNKKMINFTPDLVFTAKSHVNFNPNAKNPFITIPEDGSVWDVDSWLDSLGNQEFVGHIKEVMQAILLPLVKRDKSVWFFSPTGNNGKGTIAQLLRNLIHQDVVANIPLSQFTEPFGLARLPECMAVIADENDVHSFKKNGMEKFKAVVTGDDVTINEKFVPEFNFQFNGLVLQCINDFPKTADKTKSFYRRLHIIPFEQCFTGKQKRYIKDRLIYRQDVLEYIAKMVLMDMPFRTEFTETPMTKKVVDAYISNTNTVVEYLEEILPRAKWDLLPSQDFLYEGYKKFMKDAYPSSRVCGRNDFINAVKEYIKDIPEWEWTESCRSNGYIDCTGEAEPLLAEYELKTLMNPMYFADRDNDRKCHPAHLKEKYSGLKRCRTNNNTAGAANNAPTDDDTDN